MAEANLREAQVKRGWLRGRSQNFIDVIEDFIDEKREEYEEILEAQSDKD